MPRATRPLPVAYASRSTPSRAASNAAARAWELATSLRHRDGWVLSTASVYQAWTVHLGSRPYRIESLVSAFLEGPRGSGVVFSVAICALRGKRAIRDEVLASPWFQALRSRLGELYVNDHDTPERINLVRVLRRTTDPSTLLSELRYVAAAVEAKPARLHRAKASKSPNEDLWTVLSALGTTGWRVNGIAQSVAARVQVDETPWHVSTSFSALVDSEDGSPGTIGIVDGWPETDERTLPGGNPLARVRPLLRKNGYRGFNDIHYQHWHRGLGLRAAHAEIAFLEHVMQRLTNPST